LGGTGNLPVLGGNLPPSLASFKIERSGSRSADYGYGLVARNNGQVARSTGNAP
jgi:hypothetical protein